MDAEAILGAETPAEILRERWTLLVLRELVRAAAASSLMRAS